MTDIGVIGTYLPPWEKDGRRIAGPDEDALTMAVAAGRAADPSASARRVVMVSRNFPLLEGGNGAVLLAGLSLPADVPVAEVLGAAQPSWTRSLRPTKGPWSSRPTTPRLRWVRRQSSPGRLVAPPLPVSLGKTVACRCRAGAMTARGELTSIRGCSARRA